MKKLLITSVLAIAMISQSFAFCGFYVAKADASLFNKASQVIIVRNGEKNVITMSSDFEGDVKDFAMVVPVPVVLDQSAVKVVERSLFDKLDTYSSPRLTSYYDSDPCAVYKYDDAYDYSMKVPMAVGADRDYEGMAVEKKDYGVTIAAQYTVGEYDILILSATESTGLEKWLTDNGYKIPDKAREVLEPYINSNMKFFVVKVNLEEQKKTGSQLLRPLQITFNSSKFMLPIRLGMANGDGTQDMIVYALSPTGRIETTNYRTVELPTDKSVPLFVQDNFGEFYKQVYNRTYNRESKNCVFLEYAWDISGSVTTFCDPCNGPPPMIGELQQAGVDWISQYHYGYQGNVHFTRMHVTYDRQNFPQDLTFQETPNKANYQVRYYITHPAATTDFTCEAGQQYIKKLNQKRWEEMYNWQYLCGGDMMAHADYPKEYDKYLKTKNGQGQGSFFTGFSFGNGNGSNPTPTVLLTLITIILFFYTMTRKAKNTSPAVIPAKE